MQKASKQLITVTLLWGKSRHCPQGYGHTAFMTVFPMYTSSVHFQNKTSLFIFLPTSNVSRLLPLNCSVNFQKPVKISLLPAPTMQGQRSGVTSIQTTSVHASSNSAGGVKTQIKAWIQPGRHPHSSSLSMTMLFTTKNEFLPVLTSICLTPLLQSKHHHFMCHDTKPEIHLFISLYLHLQRCFRTASMESEVCQ